jgi:hypothetical protein
MLREVVERGANCGLAIDRADVVDMLAELVRDGMAKAYLLSGTAPFFTELQCMPPLDPIESDFKTYFYITDKGRDVLASDHVL